MFKSLIEFARSEDGAVTVDWVVLTAAIIGMGMAIVALIAGGATDMSGSLGASLEAAEPPEVNFIITN
ncbi:MAG: hypothetical protein QNJ20_01780 [Paracoccaceae bacterium]|nr:hypothetical protein [Paracoccaceae bacterium]